MQLLFILFNYPELYQLIEKTKHKPDVVQLLTDPLRWFLWSIFIQPMLDVVDNLNQTLNTTTALSFTDHHFIHQLVLAFIGVSVFIIIVLSSVRHLKNLYEGADLFEFKEILRRMIITTVLIALFIPIFSIINKAANHFNHFAQNIGSGAGFIGNEQYKTIATTFYRSPFIQDFCPDKERDVFDINDKGVKPLEGIHVFEHPEYYCYKFNFWLLLGGSIFAIIGLFIILCQMLLRVYRIAVLYVVMPLMYSLGVSDNLEYISRRASRYLYGSVFQVGFQLLALSLGSILLGYLFELLINKHDYAVFIAFISYIVFVIKVPKMVGDLFGIGLPPESIRIKGFGLR